VIDWDKNLMKKLSQSNHHPSKLTLARELHTFVFIDWGLLPEKDYD
jgi:hypothetical protein